MLPRETIAAMKSSIIINRKCCFGALILHRALNTHNNYYTHILIFNIFTYTYVNTYITVLCKYVCVCVYMWYDNTYTHTYLTHRYINIHTHICTHTHTLTYTS